MRKLTNKKGKKAQTWSLDLIIGVVLFLILIIVVYALLSSESSEDEALRQEADLVEAKLDLVNARSINLPEVFDGNKINETELKKLYQNSTAYNELKAKLGTQKDICIILVDEFGGIYNIDGYESFGNQNDNLSISGGIICGNSTG